jgi:hypothetical protein
MGCGLTFMVIQSEVVVEPVNVVSVAPCNILLHLRSIGFSIAMGVRSAVQSADCDLSAKCVFKERKVTVGIFNCAKVAHANSSGTT